MYKAQQQMQIPINVIIADDHPVMLAGIESILMSSSIITIRAKAASFDNLLKLVSEEPVDAVVIDLGGMGSAPVSTVAHLRRDYPKVGIVIFSSNIDLAPELIRLGVHGYVAKEDAETALIQGIEAAAQLQFFVSTSVAVYLEQTVATTGLKILTERETVVLKYLAQGYGTDQIATNLVIDPRSVQNHITKIRGKLGCTSRVQLVQYYHRVYGTPTS